jgi:hypothetical protein
MVGGPPTVPSHLEFVMASSSNDSGLKITIAILSVLMLVGFGLGFGMLSKRTELEQKLTAAGNEAQEAKGQASQLQTTNTELLALIGGPNSANEAKEAAMKAIGVQGVGNAKQTLLASLEAQRVTLDAANKEIDSLKKANAASQDKIRQLESIYQQRVDGHDESKKKSEQDLQKLVQTRDEELQGKDKRITALEEDLRREQVEKEQIRENADRTQKTLNEQVDQLTTIVNAQKLRLAEIEKVSFERPDGQIVSVDANLGIVFINLGTLDNLRPQISFSVYSHDHRGIGREKQDIKAAIEVTKVLGPHQAEAKILQQDRTRPISAGDPIYSPIWAGGRSEYFAFVGLIDFDKDGKSDRDTLHRLLKNAKAEVELEVNDNGERVPADAKLSQNTKFLVLGDVPDPSNFAAGDPRRPHIQGIMDQRNALLKEATMTGVRIVKLSDFMAYMGFQSQLRTYIPGEVDRFTLEQGARGSAIRSDDVTGQTSKLFEKLRKIDEAEKKAR